MSREGWKPVTWTVDFGTWGKAEIVADGDGVIVKRPEGSTLGRFMSRRDGLARLREQYGSGKRVKAVKWQKDWSHVSAFVSKNPYPQWELEFALHCTGPFEARSLERAFQAAEIAAEAVDGALAVSAGERKV